MSNEFKIVALLFICLILYISIKEFLYTKKGANSQEKAEIRSVVNKLIPDGSSYTAVYASYEEPGRTGAYRTYHYYAAAFNKNGPLWLIPLQCDKGRITYSDAIEIRKSELKRVTPHKDRTAFFDQSGSLLLELHVTGDNTLNDRACPVNIQQKEEAAQFSEYINAFAAEVNTL